MSDLKVSVVYKRIEKLLYTIKSDPKQATLDLNDWLLELDVLKPCPFCGKDVADVFDYDGYYVLCKSCKAQAALTNTPELARVAWNKRKI